MEKIISSLFSRKPSLLLCIILDILGMLSFAIPGIGEWQDVVWAPLSAYIFYNMFGGVGGILGGAFSFIEEILPFTDIIPTFTIAWFLQNKLTKTIESKKSTPSQIIEDAEVVEVS
ncbi:MAG: hypothetical protein R2831_06630 [Chitinophagaceae bacterium]